LPDAMVTTLAVIGQSTYSEFGKIQPLEHHKKKVASLAAMAQQPNAHPSSEPFPGPAGSAYQG